MEDLISLFGKLKQLVAQLEAHLGQVKLSGEEEDFFHTHATALYEDCRHEEKYIKAQYLQTVQL